MHFKAFYELDEPLTELNALESNFGHINTPFEEAVSISGSVIQLKLTVLTGHY